MRQQACQELFDYDLSDITLKQIRVAANKAWALEDDRFRDQIQAQLRWRVAAKSRGGDRRFKACRDSRSIKSDPETSKYTSEGMLQ